MTSLNGDAITASSTTPSLSIAQPDTPKPAIDEQLKHPTAASLDSGPVQAYAKLEGEGFCYYMRTLQVTMGRKVSNPDSVDIALGTLRSVSRHHARLFYNFTTQRFELMVFGKNGAIVNEQFVEKGVTVALENGTKIQIGDVSFVFLLPRMDPDEATSSSKKETATCIYKPHQLQQQPQPASQHQQQTSSSHHHQQKQTLQQQQQQQQHQKQQQPSQQQHQQQRASLNQQDAHLHPHNSSVQNDDSAQEEVFDQDTKPPYSYATLIAQAINSTPEKRMTLNSIYMHIHERYPFYKMENTGWQNSIRHNLSLNKAFVRVPRQGNEHGKGSYWTIDPEAESQFPNGIYRPNKRLANNSNTASSSNNNSIPNKGTNENDPSRKRMRLDATSTSPSTDLISSTQQQQALSQKLETPQEHQPKGANGSNNNSTSSSNSSSTAVATSGSSLGTTRREGNIGGELTQQQLQDTIRQHLLDPLRHPLPLNIAQLLPHAIAQLPPHLASQLTATLQAALRNHQAKREQSQEIPESSKTAKAPTSSPHSTAVVVTATVGQEPAPSTSPEPQSPAKEPLDESKAPPPPPPSCPEPPSSSATTTPPTSTTHTPPAETSTLTNAPENSSER